MASIAIRAVRSHRRSLEAYWASAALSGLTAEARAHVEEAHVQANHAQTLKAMDDREEALAVIGAAAEIAVMEIRSNVGLEPHAFDGWFATAGGSETACPPSTPAPTPRSPTRCCCGRMSLRLPLGAPVDGPPCIRHRPFGLNYLEIPLCWQRPSTVVRCSAVEPISTTTNSGALGGPISAPTKGDLEIATPAELRPLTSPHTVITP